MAQYEDYQDRPLPTMTRNLNIVELEYALLNALKESLGTAIVQREHGDTQFGFLLADDKRAIVILNIRDILLCKGCDKEIEWPSYKQDTCNTKECKKLAEARASVTEDDE